MNELFLKIINMSILASWLVLAVLILRFVLKKAPKWVNVLLWGIVAIRLICPFSIESPVSLIPDSVGNGELVSEWMDDYIGEINIIYDNSMYYDAAVAAGREPISDGSGAYYVVTKYDQLSEPSTIENTVMPVLTIIWITGMALLVLYTAISYLRLRRKVDTAVLCKNNIFQSENVSSPFVLGIIKPRIYLPFKLDGQDLEHVVAHEQAHIRRKDHWWKPLGFLLLTIHWFNPVMWLAYVLLCRDIELACDEKVITALGNEQRADYTLALVACSVNRRMIAACPLAFGEVGVKERVKSVMNYKKPAFWIVVLAVLSCIVVAVCFLTNPADKKLENPILWSGELTPGTTYVSYQCLYMNPASSYLAMGGDSGCKYIVGEDYFATINRNYGSFVSVNNPNLDTANSGLDGLQNKIDVSKWEWQEFPYTDEEWEALYVPLGFGVISNISELYNEMLYQPLTAGKFLLKMDSALWLVELHSSQQVGTQLWSIYSLVPEAAMGVAQWEYAPMLSSRCPYFRFEFDMDYTEIYAVCTQSPLVDFDAPGTPSKASLTFREGNALYWSPIDEDGNVVTAAIIHFSVSQDDTSLYSGTIYIEGNSDSGGRRIYTAAIVGTGLHLGPNSEKEGGVITDIASPNGIQVVEHDLTTGNLEVSVEDLANYVFYTNSTQISVTVKGGEFEGQVNLLDISQNNAQIMQAKVNTRDDDCLFTGLTSARLYRVACENLDGCAVIISEDG